MQLREYQRSAVNSIWKYFQDGNTGNPVVVMPTGTGKSLVIAGFLQSVYQHYPTERVMMLTHVKELIEQNYDKLIRMWPTAPAGIYSAGLKKRELGNSITFAGIGSVARKANLFGNVDLILIDEADLVSTRAATQYRKFIAELKEVNPDLKVIGFTATPYRMSEGPIIPLDGDDQELLDKLLFDDICFDMSTMEAFNWLIAEGYLSPLIPKRTQFELDVDGVHMRGGEFIAKELQEAVDQEELTRKAILEAKEDGDDRKCWLVFTTGIEHTINTTEMLNQLGVSAKCVHSGNADHKFTNADRDDAINSLKNGSIRALVNNNVLTTGFDHPEIDLIMVIRPSGSTRLWIQMLGRGTRPVYAEGYDLLTKQGRLDAMEASVKQDCLVLDYAANTKRLGPINDPVVPRRKGKGKGTAPIKACEQCNIYIHASLTECPHCGYIFTYKTKLKEGASTHELIKMETPVLEDFKINHIVYYLHKKIGKPDSVRISYHCDNNRTFKDFVCLEHKGWAAKSARDWWRNRSDSELPETTEELLNRTGDVKTATSLRVWINKKYPEVMQYCFDGTHFGAEDFDEFVPSTASQGVALTGFDNLTANSKEVLAEVNQTAQVEAPADFHDDIPF